MFFPIMICADDAFKKHLNQAEVSVTVVCAFAEQDGLEHLTTTAEGSGQMIVPGTQNSAAQMRRFDVPFTYGLDGTPSVNAAAVLDAMAKVIG
jgi:hypothetical protein